MWELNPEVETGVCSLKFAAAGVDGSLEVLTNGFPIEPRSVTAPGFDTVPQIYSGEVVQLPCPQRFPFPTDITVPMCFVERLERDMYYQMSCVFLSEIVLVA